MEEEVKRSGKAVSCNGSS